MLRQKMLLWPALLKRGRLYTFARKAIPDHIRKEGASPLDSNVPTDGRCRRSVLFFLGKKLEGVNGQLRI